MGKGPKKVAYAVFRGRQPGIYDSWIKAEEQVKGFSGAHHRGYTKNDGGWQAALCDFTSRLADKSEVIDNSCHNRRAPSSTWTIEKLQEDTTVVQKKRKRDLHLSEHGYPKRKIKGHHAESWSPHSISRSISRTDEGADRENGENGSSYYHVIAPKLNEMTSSTPQGSTYRTSPALNTSAEAQSATRPSENHIDTAQEEDGDSSDYGSLTEDEITELESFEAQRTVMGSSVQPSPASSFTTPQPLRVIPEARPENPSLPWPGPSQDQEPPLCEEQRELVDLIVAGHNVFYTGSAGCGKSTVLRAFVNRLRSNGKRVDIIAPTGIGALNVQGQTIFTFAGWSPDSVKKPISTILRQAHRKRVWRRLVSAEVLVIDEISMVENHSLERLNYILKEARGTDTAFGGVQLIVTGDFCQLPPVKPFQFCFECGEKLIQDEDTREHYCPDLKSCGSRFLDDDMWAFRSFAWEEAKFVYRNLTTIHRQVDPSFRIILEKVRYGHRLSWIEMNLLEDHTSKIKDAIKLVSKKDEAKKINRTEFNKLYSQQESFFCNDVFRLNGSEDHSEVLGERLPPHDSLTMLHEHRYEVELKLKIGMRVLLLANLNTRDGLANGSQGEIVSFCDEKFEPQLPRYDDDEDEESHKKASMKHRGLLDFIEQRKKPCWPVVRFNNGVTRPIFPECEISEFGSSAPFALAGRAQIPLVAAWAITIHKCQGMTLSELKVDLHDCFAEGQAYVALSRARSLDGLKVKGLDSRWEHGLNQQVAVFLHTNFDIG